MSDDLLALPAPDAPRICPCTGQPSARDSIYCYDLSRKQASINNLRANGGARVAGEIDYAAALEADAVACGLLDNVRQVTGSSYGALSLDAIDPEHAQLVALEDARAAAQLLAEEEHASQLIMASELAQEHGLLFLPAVEEAAEQSPDDALDQVLDALDVPAELEPLDAGDDADEAHEHAAKHSKSKGHKGKKVAAAR